MRAVREIAPLLAVVLLAWFVYEVAPLAGDYPARITLDCGIAIVLAVSLNIVSGFTGQFSIGHAAFMALGGYVAGFLTYYSSLVLWHGAAAPWWLFVCACIIGGIGAATAGWVVGLPSLRLRGDYLAIVTLGFGEIVRVCLQQTNQQLFSMQDFKSASWLKFLFLPAVGGAQGFSDIPKFTNLFWTYLAVGLCVLFAYRLKSSSYGRALLSIRENEVAAEAMGINVTKLKVRAFMFAAFFAGIAGSLYAHEFGVLLRPVDAGFQRSFDIIIMVVLGGLGSISGSALAAILLVVVQYKLLDLEQYHVLEFRMPVFALLLIVTMIFRPQGLFGLHEVWDFWRGTKP